MRRRPWTLAIAAALVLRAAAAPAAPMCVDIDPAPYRSGCGNITGPSTVRAGETFTVSADWHCSGASISASHTLPQVIVDGAPMTAPLGVAPMYGYDPPVPGPPAGAMVTLPAGAHTVQFTADPAAATNCVRASGQGPWFVLGAGSWSSVQPFDFQGSSDAELEATITPDPADVGVGDSFTVTLHVTNTGPVPVTGISTSVTPHGDGEVEQTEAPDPETVDLAAGASHDFVYRFDATMKGDVVLKGRAEGTGPDDGLVFATALCGLGGTGGLVARTGSCPIGGGTKVTISDCTLQDRSMPLAVSRLTGDSTPSPSQGYQQGFT